MMAKDLDYYVSLDYEIKLRKLTEEEGSGWLAEIPTLPGCMADGETVDEALENLKDAKMSWIETALELGRIIPEPSTEDFSGQLRVRMPKTLHRTLSEMAKEENVSLNQLIIYHLSKGVGRKL
jgi:predicted RNase H-like HicB family nuclease